ncbi:PilW family protein [Roseateles sp. DC23W]|uniref:PilW family protein n=1 Tax=Pelomonas dachongensis TaxID=3299029 RepID=A0ABW7EIU0_9BURK
MRTDRHAAQRGLGLVELMVGITIGLIVAAGASIVAVNQITEHRRLMLEMQVQQDLRAAADLLQQDLRRAGFRGQAQYGLWTPATGVGTPAQRPAQAASANRYAAVADIDNDQMRAIEYLYARKDGGNYPASGAPRDNEYFGIKWDKNTKALYLKLGRIEGRDNWQPITDPETVEILDFSVDIQTQDISLAEFCDNACVGANCPVQQVRHVEFQLQGRAKHDRQVVRSLNGSERIRADAVIGACPA